MMSRYYDRDGAPIHRDIWASRFADQRNKVVALTDLPGVSVSTVWLGLDHSWGDDSPPLIFETMVFGGALDQEQERYSTESEAIAGHAAMVERVQVAEKAMAARNRLIEAAPALLTALTELVRLKDDPLNGGTSEAMREAAWAAARSALALAVVTEGSGE